MQNSGLEIFGLCVLYIVSSIISAIFNGCVFLKFWSWFVASTFNVQNISICTAIGLMLLINYVTYHDSPVIEDRSLTEKFSRLIAKGIIAPLIMLFIGWIVYQCMVY
jgi:hypothetical protein